MFFVKRTRAFGRGGVFWTSWLDLARGFCLLDFWLTSDEEPFFKFVSEDVLAIGTGELLLDEEGAGCTVDALEEYAGGESAAKVCFWKNFFQIIFNLGEFLQKSIWQE